MKSTIALLAVLLYVCACVSAVTPGREFYRPSSLAAVSNERVRVSLYLRQSNRDVLERRFWEVRGASGLVRCPV